MTNKTLGYIQCYCNITVQKTERLFTRLVLKFERVENLEPLPSASKVFITIQDGFGGIDKASIICVIYLL